MRTPEGAKSAELDTALVDQGLGNAIKDTLDDLLDLDLW